MFFILNLKAVFHYKVEHFEDQSQDLSLLMLLCFSSLFHFTPDKNGCYDIVAYIINMRLLELEDAFFSKKQVQCYQNCTGFLHICIYTVQVSLYCTHVQCDLLLKVFHQFLQ